MFHVVPGFANRKIDFGQNLAIFWSNLPFLTFKCELRHFHVFWNSSYIFWNFGLKFGTNHLCMDLKKLVCRIFEISPHFRENGHFVHFYPKIHENQRFFDICPLFFKMGHDIKNLVDQFFYIYTKMICAKFQPKIPKNVGGVPKNMKVP